MKESCRLGQTCLFLSAIILGAMASFSHFAFALSGRNPIVGFFNPVNESVWEHMKFMVFPLLLWWIFMYPGKKKHSTDNILLWVFAASITLILAPIFTAGLYYGYTGVLGQEFVTVDILLVFLVYWVVLRIGNHVLCFASPSAWAAVLGGFLVLALIAAMIAFTNHPPELPLFRDPLTGGYGII